MTQYRITASLLALSLGFLITASAQTPSTPLTSTPVTSSKQSPDTATPSVVPNTAAPGKKHVYSLSASSEALKLTNDIATAKAQVDKNPDDPEAHFLLAAAYSRSPYLEQAFSEIKKTKELLKQKQDFEFIDKTVDQYETLAKQSPTDTVILYRLAFAYYLKGYSLEKYPQHYKQTPTGNAQDFYAKAKSTMSKVIALDPKDIWARNYLGYMVSDNGKDLPKAITIWEDSLAVDKDHNPGAYLLLSAAYFKKGDPVKALNYQVKGREIQANMGMTLP